jgi:hypothetical protein
MSFAGKTSDFTRDDILRVGGNFGIKSDGRAIAEQVAELCAWPEVAAAAGRDQGAHRSDRQRVAHELGEILRRVVTPL